VPDTSEDKEALVLHSKVKVNSCCLMSLLSINLNDHLSLRCHWQCQCHCFRGQFFPG